MKTFTSSSINTTPTSGISSWARSPMPTSATFTASFLPGMILWSTRITMRFGKGFWPYLKTPTVPNLNVAGWWDQEDFYGPVHIYELMEKNDPKHLNYL